MVAVVGAFQRLGQPVAGNDCAQAGIALQLNASLDSISIHIDTL